jgi:hypothetical protein
MKRLIDGILMDIQADKRNGRVYYQGRWLDSEGKRHTKYLGKQLPEERHVRSVPPDDGLFRCCHCGQHETTDELFSICQRCRQLVLMGSHRKRAG